MIDPIHSSAVVEITNSSADACRCHLPGDAGALDIDACRCRQDAPGRPLLETGRGPGPPAPFLAERLSGEERASGPRGTVLRVAVVAPLVVLAVALTVTGLVPVLFVTLALFLPALAPLLLVLLAVAATGEARTNAAPGDSPDEPPAESSGGSDTPVRLSWIVR
jgi:hypothetical protein